MYFSICVFAIEHFSIDFRYRSLEEEENTKLLLQVEGRQVV